MSQQWRNPSYDHRSMIERSVGEYRRKTPAAAAMSTDSLSAAA
jgi:hypothetical protein